MNASQTLWFDTLGWVHKNPMKLIRKDSLLEQVQEEN